MAEKNVSSAKDKELKAVESKKKANKEPMTFKKIITIAIIVILALLMVGGFSYVVTMFNQSKAEAKSAWGSYNGESIVLENNNVFYNTLVNNENFQMAYLTGDYNSLMSIYSNAYQQQVLFTALKQEAEAAGIVAPQDIVDDMILASGVYNDADGNFSADAYKAASEADKLTVNNYYKSLVPYSTVLNDLQSAIVSEAETEFVGNIAGMVRNFEYFVINYNVYPEEKAIKFAMENASLFDTLDLSILTATEENAKQAYEALKAGSDWADVVASYSQDSYKETAGKVGEIALYGILTNLADETQAEAIKALAVGSYSEPIANPSGAYTIYKLDSAIRPADFKDEMTLRSVKYYITNNDIDDVTPYVQAAIESAAALAQTDFEKAAQSVNAEIVTVETSTNNVANSSYFGGISYYDANGYLAAVAQDQAVSRELYTSELNHVTGAMEVAEAPNTYVVARVTDIDDNNDGMKSITTMFYEYYAASQPVNDKAYAIFNDEKYVDNFYTQFFSTVLGNMI
ncbi:MAG: SurA N-terminal domain-containing protein [Sphaerochaetaceae bacterium]|nr:SurA N-terminal domain-containing protein [Sphaerochaetaceae bacterium]